MEGKKPNIKTRQGRSVARTMDLARKSVGNRTAETADEKKEQQRITRLYDTQMRSADFFEYRDQSKPISKKLSEGAAGFRRIAELQRWSAQAELNKAITARIAAAKTASDEDKGKDDKGKDDKGKDDKGTDDEGTDKGTSGGPNYPSKEELQNIVDNLKGSGTTDKYQVRDDEGNPTGEWVYGAEYHIPDVDVHGYPEGWKQERVTKDGEEFTQITTDKGRVYWKPVGGDSSGGGSGDTGDDLTRSGYQTDAEKAASDAATATRDADALALERREKRRKLRLQKPWLFGRLSLLSGRNELGVTSSLLGGG